METVACAGCDLLRRFPPIPPGGNARCPRCGNTLATQPRDPLDRPLALTVKAAIVLLVANTAPLMGLLAVGRHASTTIAGGAYEVALIEIAELATVTADVGIYAVGGLVVLLPASMATFDAREAWRRVAWVGGGSPPLSEARDATRAGAGR